MCRSLITLKALTYAPTGGMCAAPTTSLPECIGGARNWDYRFCWLRDATLTLLALMNAGYYDEAQRWRDWLLRAAAGSPWQIQIMYGIRGERRLTEWEVPWLPGYENSAPVRIGNAAHNQLQLDIFGEVMDALHQARAGGLGGYEARLGPAARIPRASGEDLARARQRHLGGARRARAFHLFQGDGLGRLRPRHQERGELRAAGPGRALARRCATQIHNDVCERGFDDELGSFVRSYGSKELDASLLLLPAIGFLPADDPRITRTVEAIERALMVDGLVRRYDTEKSDDGLPAGRGRVPGLQLLAGRRLSDARPPRRRGAAVRAAAGAAQRRRAAERGIRAAHRAGWSAIFRRPFRIWRWSIAPAISRITASRPSSAREPRWRTSRRKAPAWLRAYLFEAESPHIAASLYLTLEGRVSSECAEPRQSKTTLL